MSQLARPTHLLLFFAILGGTTMLVAQTTTIHRPTEDSGGYSNPANAFDGNSSTFSFANVSGSSGGANICCNDEKWHGFSAVNGTPTSIKLKVTSSVEGVSPCGVVLEYATDGGGNPLTYKFIYNGGINRSQETDDVTLPTSQDLTKVWVDAEVSCPEGSHAGIQQNIYEIWIEVTE